MLRMIICIAVYHKDVRYIIIFFQVNRYLNEFRFVAHICNLLTLFTLFNFMWINNVTCPAMLGAIGSPHPLWTGARGASIASYGPKANFTVLFGDLMSTHISILVDSVRPSSAEVCRTAANFP
jgi:hypothetical protein